MSRDLMSALGGCRWSFVTGKMNKQGAEDKLRQAGVLLFHNLFELEPRLRQLFPFKTGDGHIADKVRAGSTLAFMFASQSSATAVSGLGPHPLKTEVRSPTAVNMIVCVTWPF